MSKLLGNHEAGRAISVDMSQLFGNIEDERAIPVDMPQVLRNSESEHAIDVPVDTSRVIGNNATGHTLSVDMAQLFENNEAKHSTSVDTSRVIENSETGHTMSVDMAQLFENNEAKHAIPVDMPQESGNSEKVEQAKSVYLRTKHFVFIKTGDPHYTIRIPVAANYDLDNDYDYIMSRALKSYRQHREKEKADTRKGPLKSSYLRRHQLRPKTAPPTRFIETIRVQNATAAANNRKQYQNSVFMPQVDAINEVSRANPVSPDDMDRSPRRVLQVAKVSINMMQDTNRKTASYLKRNQPSHPWHSHSYPSVRPMDKFVRPPHAYMSASVGERELSSALSSNSSRSSSAKSSPQHTAGCRPKTATNSKNNSKYYYDGGLFTHPKNDHPDYFVIHPDWVSESMSIQKLSLTERTKQLPRQLPKSKSMTWPGRRCNSAPPSRYRNPITWESVQTT